MIWSLHSKSFKYIQTLGKNLKEPVILTYLHDQLSLFVRRFFLQPEHASKRLVSVGHWPTWRNAGLSIVSFWDLCVRTKCFRTRWEQPLSWDKPVVCEEQHWKMAGWLKMFECSAAHFTIMIIASNMVMPSFWFWMYSYQSWIIINHPNTLTWLVSFSHISC